MGSGAILWALANPKLDEREVLQAMAAAIWRNHKTGAPEHAVAGRIRSLNTSDLFV
ncbi:hypothetical protein SNL152K_10522 [Streptomyces sp. NL15-2K]|nr:hypothetical protein SNL152K_10522 [Streptomyces sp. NL15-2K]